MALLTKDFFNNSYFRSNLIKISEEPVHIDLDVDVSSQ